MKALLVTLLVLLISTQVLSLRCYDCTGTDDTCTRRTTCQNTDTVCVVHENNGAVTRSCAPSCQEDLHTSCCSENDCNGP